MDWLPSIAHRAGCLLALVCSSTYDAVNGESLLRVKPWLLVEDEPDISEMLLAVFDIWQIECVAHQNGEETLAWLERVNSGEVTELPELALIDIRLMGEIDGITVSQRIRSCPALKHITIVLNTAYSLTEQEKQHCLQISGADRVMSKPLPRFDRLYEELQSLIEKNADALDDSASEEVFIANMEEIYPPVSVETRAIVDAERAPMRSLSPGGGISRQARRRLQSAILVVSGGSFLALIGLALSVIPLVGREGSFAKVYLGGTQGLMIGGIILALLGLWLAGRAYRRRDDDSLARRTGMALRQQLDSRFTFITRLNVRGLSDIDALIAGPPGLLVLRLLDMRGDLYQEHGHWLQQSKRGDFIPLSFNPTRELLHDILRLRSQLTKSDLADFPVFGVIVSTRPLPELQYHSSGEIIPMAYLSSLAESLAQNYLRRERVTMRALRAALQQLRIPFEA